MGKPVEVADLSFPTKAKATEYFQRILYAYEFGEEIGEPDATEIGWLLERHHEVVQKTGSGVKHFSVRPASFNTRCFEVARTDGSTTDFSFKTCIDGKAASAERQVLDALRAEVTNDVLDKKREWFSQKGDASGNASCSLTGVPITFETSHADHAPPRTFGTLANAFLAARKIAPSVDLLQPSADNQYLPLLADRTLAKDWVDYHHEMAVMRVTVKGANLANAHAGKVREKDRQLNFR